LLRWDESELRRQFPFTRDTIYLNTGTVGLCPMPVVDALLEWTRAAETTGQQGWGDAEGEMNRARARLAAWLGARSDEIVFTRNATDGTNLVTNGIDWQPGDEVLLSAEEHPSMELPWHYLQQQGRVRLRRFPVSRDPRQTLAAVEAGLTRRARLVATSHVFSHSGNRSPAEALARLCRSRGVMLHLDGAQAVGQFRLDLSTIGADFYTGNCHKWLLGPKGTGFLYVRSDRLDSLRPFFVGAGSASGFCPVQGLTFPTTSRRFEFATRDFARYAALNPLLDWWEATGADRIECHARGLAAALRHRLAQIPGLVFHTAAEWDDSSAMTTFSLPGRTTQEVMGCLWDRHRIQTRGVHEWEAVRVSTAVYNQMEEIDRLVSTLDDLTRS
jgi:selenocysteine lyase/cysteine desulfurase